MTVASAKYRATVECGSYWKKKGSFLCDKTSRDLIRQGKEDIMN